MDCPDALLNLAMSMMLEGESAYDYEDDEIPDLDSSDISNFMNGTNEEEVWKGECGNVPESPFHYKLDAKNAAKRLVKFGVLNKADKTVKFVEYLGAGNYLDSKTIVKRMPWTALDLEEGKVTEEDFCKYIDREIYNVVYPSLETQMPSFNHVKKNREDMTQEIAGFLVNMALQHVYLFNSSRHPLCLKFEADLKQRVKDFQTNDNQHAEGSMFASIHFYKSALDEVIDKYGKLMDQVFYAGLCCGFVNNCAVYNLPIMQFFSIAEILFKKTSNYRQMLILDNLVIIKAALREAVASIATKNADDAKNRCWECFQLHSVPTDLLSCSQCHVANYCSDTCQKKAWKSGHKQCCKGLKQAHVTFRESFNLVKALHPTGDSSTSSTVQNQQDFPYKLNEVSDYSIFQTIVTQQEFQFQDNTSDNNSSSAHLHLKPSMKQFYQNLKNIQQQPGKFWLFPQPTGVTNETADKLHYQSKILGSAPTAELALEAEQEYFLRIAHVLCFDIRKIATGLGGMRVPSIGHALQLEGITDVAMPLERFLALYHTDTFHLSKNRQQAEQRMRRMKKANAYATLRDTFHK